MGQLRRRRVARPVRPEQPLAADGPSATSSVSVPAAAKRHLWARRTVLNWRLFVVRVIAAGAAVVLTILIVPGLGFTGWKAGQFAVVVAAYSLLAAVIKPFLQFVSLRFLVATYGLVVIVVNGFLLYLLANLLPGLIEYHRVWQLLLGGFVVGVLGLVLETVLGATPPVVDRKAGGS